MDYGPTTVAAIIISLFAFLVEIWAIVDILKRPSIAWEAAGKSRIAWLLFMIVGIFMCNLGFFAAIWYLFMIGPQVKRMEHESTGRIGFPGGSGNFPD